MRRPRVTPLSLSSRQSQLLIRLGLPLLLYLGSMFLGKLSCWALLVYHSCHNSSYHHSVLKLLLMHIQEWVVCNQTELILSCMVGWSESSLHRLRHWEYTRCPQSQSTDLRIESYQWNSVNPRSKKFTRLHICPPSNLFLGPRIWPVWTYSQEKLLSTVPLVLPLTVNIRHVIVTYVLVYMIRCNCNAMVWIILHKTSWTESSRIWNRQALTSRAFYFW